MKIIVKLFDVLATSVIIAAALLFVPVLFGMKPYIVLSGSMEPEIKTGSVVYVNTRKDIDEIKVGDIIAFYSGGNAVTHRVTRINKNHIVTKGDANRTDDKEIVTSENYIGKTEYTIPFIGYALNSLRSPFVIAILIFIVGTHLILTAINYRKGELQ